MVLIGHPLHRRVTGFVSACEGRGVIPIVRSHLELLEEPERLLDLDEAPRFVRIDSFGEDLHVERALLALGYDGAVAEGAWTLDRDELAAYEIAYGEVVAPRQQALGLIRQLERLDAVLKQRPAWRVLTPPLAAARLFDKKACWQLHHKAGISVPEASIQVVDPDGIRAEASARGWRQVYVKLRSGSSASCLALYDPGHEVLTTTLKKEDDRWYNVLKPTQYRGRASVDEVLRFLIRESVHVENGLRKAMRDRRFLDLRMLVVDGEPAFVVERQSPHPITNLHLGGQRGDVDELRALVGAEVWSSIEDTARAVSAVHGCFQLGVDVAILRGFKDHAVLEANAFGDLLPGLTRDGLSVYEWELSRLPVTAND